MSLQPIPPTSEALSRSLRVADMASALRFADPLDCPRERSIAYAFAGIPKADADAFDLDQAALRNEGARRAAYARGSIGDAVAAAIPVPGGMLAVGFASLFPVDAEAATSPFVATGPGVFAVALFSLVIGCGIGFIVGLLAVAPRDFDDGRNDREYSSTARRSEIVNLRNRPRR